MAFCTCMARTPKSQSSLAIVVLESSSRTAASLSPQRGEELTDIDLTVLAPYKGHRLTRMRTHSFDDLISALLYFALLCSTFAGNRSLWGAVLGHNSHHKLRQAP